MAQGMEWHMFRDSTWERVDDDTSRVLDQLKLGHMGETKGLQIAMKKNGYIALVTHSSVTIGDQTLRGVTILGDPFVTHSYLFNETKAYPLWLRCTDSHNWRECT